MPSWPVLCQAQTGVRLWGYFVTESHHRHLRATKNIDMALGSFTGREVAKKTELRLVTRILPACGDAIRASCLTVVMADSGEGA